MAKNETDTNLTSDDSEGVGIRATVTQETADILTKLEATTGLSRGELIGQGLMMLQRDGKDFLVKAIQEKAQATINKLLNSSS